MVIMEVYINPYTMYVWCLCQKCQFNYTPSMNGIQPVLERMKLIGFSYVYTSILSEDVRLCSKSIVNMYFLTPLAFTCTLKGKTLYT